LPANKLAFLCGVIMGKQKNISATDNAAEELLQAVADIAGQDAESEELYKILNKLGVYEIKRGDTLQKCRNYFSNPSNDMVSVSDRFIRTIREYELKAEKIRDSLSKYDGLLALEFTRESKRQKQQRKYDWIDWGQRLVRWCVGAVMAVLLYSCLVWFSQPDKVTSEVDYQFIKIPVKDWIPKNSN